MNKSFCISVLLIFFALTGLAQQKRMLTKEDYKLWSLPLYPIYGQLSNNGNWVMFPNIPSGQAKTSVLHIQNLSRKVQYNFSDARIGKFTNNNKWCAFLKKDSLGLLELASGKIKYFSRVSEFLLSANDRFLIAVNSFSKEKSISVIDLNTLNLIAFSDVKELRFNSQNTALAMIIKDGLYEMVKTVVFDSNLPVIAITPKVNKIYNGLSWSKNGTSLAFFEQDKGEQISTTSPQIVACTNATSNPINKVLDPLSSTGFPKQQTVVKSKLSFSDDGKQIFFQLKEDEKLPQEAGVNAKNKVQVWFSDSEELKKDLATRMSFSWCWWIDTDKILQITDREYPMMVLTGDQKNALIYNPLQYNPQYKYGSDKYVDLYIKDLSTGSKKIVIKKILQTAVQISPAGKFITYFMEEKWWVYDILLDRHYCITESMEVPFHDQNYYAFIKIPYSSPAWLENDSRILICDQFDVWSMKPDGSEKVNLTSLRKLNISARFNFQGLSIDETPITFRSAQYNSDQGFLLKMLNNYNLDEGYCYWTKKKGIKILVNKSKKLKAVGSDLESVKAGGDIGFLYEESDFDVPPRLVFVNNKGKTKILYDSNPQQKDFYWGKSELIHYEVNGKNLKGVLLYPANYDPNKKYPVIVNVYQIKSNLLHDYVIPSDKLFGDINYSVFTAKGYFILLPDIINEVNNPGISALQCTMSAVNKILGVPGIDKDNIGLVGHSFGGYETAFIVSQTNFFKTAVIGSAITDPTSWALTISPDFGVNLSRVEYGQLKLQTPFYGEDFTRNSPLANVGNINTPVLIWTGGKDRNVDPEQSKRLHIALWRLGKNSTLLIYPDEGHALYEEEINQMDYGVKIENWFDHYLKGARIADWMQTKDVNKN